VAAANFAGVNSENLLVIENYVRRPGHHEPRFGGGVCGFDLETNSEADHSKNIGVYNNLFDYEAGLEGAGNAICLQAPYRSPNQGKVIAANNVAIGGRSEHSDHRYMSNGMFLVGLKQCEIVNNYVFRTGQNGLQAYALDGCLVQDNIFESTGGGGNSTVALNNVSNSTFRRNPFRSRPGVTINTQAGIIDKCGKGNIFEDNRGNDAISPPNAQCQ
jgi:hypothetical protein